MENTEKEIGKILIQFYDSMKAVEKITDTQEREGKKATLVIMAMNDLSQFSKEKESEPMSKEKFNVNGEMFGMYCTIEQKRYAGENEHYQYKIINRLESNTWVNVPIDSRVNNGKETTHETMEQVVSCICCGVSETEVLKFRLKDVKVSLPAPIDEGKIEEIKFKAYIPVLGITLEKIALYPDGTIGIDADYFSSQLIKGKHQWNGDEEVYGWDAEEECFTDALLSVLVGDDWLWIEKGDYELSITHVRSSIKKGGKNG